MKCIKLKDSANPGIIDIRRVSDEVAAKVISNDPDWEYCPKELWKVEVRDAQIKRAKERVEAEKAAAKKRADELKAKSKKAKPGASKRSLKGKARKKKQQ